MSNLIVRKIPFEFEGVDFLWNPKHTQFSVLINLISFWVIGLDSYFVKTLLEAEKILHDP